MEFIVGLILAFLSGFIINKIIRTQKNAHFLKKLSLQGNEIEIFEDSNDSYFDRYLNEVLYLFEHTEADGIIFEDIDRYDSNCIFEKLREMNYLLNHRNEMHITNKDRKIIRFFYLLRDDIFISKDRTKFFDFIIPIVPVVDASNAYDQFIKHFKDGNIIDLFDENFLQGLSLYVDDMRILKNIYNEFVIYHEKFITTSTEQNNNKLLAMISYKNLFPKDFSELQLGRGYVYTLFLHKEDFKKTQINEIQDEIDKLELEKENIKKELCNDMDELNSIYFCVNGRISVDGKEENEYKTRKEFVHDILNKENISRYSSYNVQWVRLNIEAEKKKMEQDVEYINRKEIIAKKENAGIKNNDAKIIKLKTKIELIKSVYLRDLISRENSNRIFLINYVNDIDEEVDFAEIKRSPYFSLIKYLITNGYIEETYPDYMTFFYANSITANDKIFLRSITDQEAKPFEYKLNNVALVISRMRIIDFEEEESLNFQILDCLLSNTKLYKMQLQHFFYRIWNVEPVDFVRQYLESGIEKNKFTEEFNRYFAEACSWIIKTEEFPKNIKRQYLLDTICVSTDEVIEKNNKDNIITNFVNNDLDFLSINNFQEKKVTAGLLKLGIKFSFVDFENANSNLLQYIYINNLYQINMKMIQEILKFFYKINNIQRIKEKNLTCICSNKNEPLYKYITNNIDNYFSMLLSNITEIKDSESIVIFVLNNDEVSYEHKEQYFSISSTILEKLKAISDKRLWNNIIDQEKVIKSNDN